MNYVYLSLFLLYIILLLYFSAKTGKFLKSIILVGIVGISDVVVQTSGIINYLHLLAVISVSLGVTNLLPIPALDGGRLFFLAIEFIRGGKKIDPNKEGMINMIGFSALMLFMLFITYKDIVKLIGM